MIKHIYIYWSSDDSTHKYCSSNILNRFLSCEEAAFLSLARALIKYVYILYTYTVTLTLNQRRCCLMLLVLEKEREREIVVNDKKGGG